MCGLLPMYNAVVTGGDVVWHRLQEDASVPETHKSASMSANWQRGGIIPVVLFSTPRAEDIHIYCCDIGIQKQIQVVLLQIHGSLVAWRSAASVQLQIFDI